MGDPKYFDRITWDDVGACVLIGLFLVSAIWVTA